MNDFESFQREIEAALPVLNRRAESEYQARIIWGGEDPEHEEMLRKLAERGWPTQAGFLSFDRDDFQLKLYLSEDKLWGADTLEILLKLNLEFPSDGSISMSELFDCQSFSQFIVDDEEDSLLIFGVVVGVPRNGLDGDILANAISHLRASAGALMQLLDDAEDDADRDRE